MPSYEHKKLVERIAALSRPPIDVSERTAWLDARNHLQLLEDNALEDELIVVARDAATSIQSIVVKVDKLYPLDEDDLLGWQGTGFEPRAQHVWQAGQDEVQIEESRDLWMSRTLSGAQRLVFGRQLSDSGDDDGAYYEILQEYTHAFGAHWRPNERAFCDFDEHGDLMHVISITLMKDRGKANLVSFRRKQLEQYLALTDSILVRMFDFELLPDLSQIDTWSDVPEALFRRGESVFGKQQVNPGVGSFTRGVQIVRPSRSKSEILEQMRFEQRTGSSVEFTAYDWRNRQTIEMSTGPLATPDFFELSLVCFRPEVLLRYKGDRDKYTFDERFRTITCRGGWQLKYDTNEAGQVTIYIVRLRALPYHEQLYWKAFNEKPRVGLSKRAFRRDIAGLGAEPTPIVRMLNLLEGWDSDNVPWWKLRNKRLFERINTPYGESRDEWAQAFEDLAKLVVEGFETVAIRNKLRELGIEFSKDEKSIALLEKLVSDVRDDADGAGLGGLHAAQRIRTKVEAHARGHEAAEIVNQAKQQHGTFAAHFQSVCAAIADELNQVQESFTRQALD